MGAPPVGVRWTIGDVSARGFEALGLSIAGALRVFGPEAEYAVCVNTVPIDVARRRTGPIADAARFLDAGTSMPPAIARHFDDAYAEGVGWKYAPLRVFPDRHEIALDNDCVLWAMPEAVRRWLDDDGTALLCAEDVKRCFGQFDGLCAPGARNAGLRGMPPGFDLEAAILDVLAARPVRLASELDEQGLSVAALERGGPLHVVAVDDVSICSPFPPHVPRLGRAGAHFVGVNARRSLFEIDGVPATAILGAHFDALRDEVRARVAA
jgi:hypothetical protein